MEIINRGNTIICYFPSGRFRFRIRQTEVLGSGNAMYARNPILGWNYHIRIKLALRVRFRREPARPLYSYFQRLENDVMSVTDLEPAML
jgi:hypothetical protein